MDLKLGAENADKERKTTLYASEIDACIKMFKDYVTPKEVQEHSSLAGVSLDKDLNEFEDMALANFRTYASRGLYGQKLMPCFALSSEKATYVSIENQTIADLKHMLVDLVSQLRILGDDDEADIITCKIKRTRLHVDFVSLHQDTEYLVTQLKSLLGRD